VLLSEKEVGAIESISIVELAVLAVSDKLSWLAELV
jgi:hypothetical protein